MSTTSPSITDLQCISKELRARVIQMSHDGRAPHLGSSLSCIDILVAAYWNCLNIDPSNPNDPGRDRFILSKGHAAAALYATLAKRGFFNPTELDSYNIAGSRLPEQPMPNALPGVEAATGSLGHGLSLGLGMALAARIQARDCRVMAVVSDGECNEGTVWEAAMFAAAQRLDSATVVVDFNRWQATDRSEEVMAISPLVDKWQAFGWATAEMDGHDIQVLSEYMNQSPLEAGKPTALIAHTTKGKGVSFMEDDNNWHYRVPNDEELAAALAELGVANA